MLPYVGVNAFVSAMAYAVMTLKDAPVFWPVGVLMVYVWGVYEVGKADGRTEELKERMEGSYVKERRRIKKSADRLPSDGPEVE